MRRILVDTHIFLWWISNSDHHRLGQGAKQLIVDARNEIFVSAASVWEISTKKRLGALSAPDDIDSIVEDKGFLKLPISLFHSQNAGSMSEVMHPQTNKAHKDPFDRMLVAQAQAEGLELMTCDAVFPAYGIKLINGYS